MEIEIRQITNGFIVIDNNASGSIEQQTCFEYDEDDQKSMQKAFTKMVKYIAQLSGEPLAYDSWSSENIRISWDKKGDEL